MIKNGKRSDKQKLLNLTHFLKLFILKAYSGSKQQVRHSTMVSSGSEHVLNDPLLLKKSHTLRATRTIEKPALVTSFPSTDPFSLEMKTCPTALQLKDIEHDPVIALMSFAVNSGHARFIGAEHLHRTFDDPNSAEYDSYIVPEQFKNLIAEIEQEITDESEERIVTDYLQAINKSARLVTCASCGMKAFEMGDVRHHVMPVSSSDVLRCSQEKIDVINSTPCEFRYTITNLYSFI